MGRAFTYPERIARWHGTDALMLAMYPPGMNKLRVFLHRLIWRSIHRFFQHEVNHIGLKKILNNWGIDEVTVKPIPHRDYSYLKPYVNPRKILFYLPGNSKYKDWIYGKDIINKVMRSFPDDKRYYPEDFFIIVTGDSDMPSVYTQTAGYIKINMTRYNSKNRMAKECESAGIPVYVYNDWNNYESIGDIVEWINTKLDILPIKGEKVCSCKK